MLTTMTMTYRSLASTILLVAVTVSAIFQLYRASLGTPYAVDRFGLTAAVAYAAMFAVATAVRMNRRWVWWTVSLLLILNLVYAVVGYYPGVYAARPLDLIDWLEGTVYTGLLMIALGCTLLQLTGTTLSPTPRKYSGAPKTGAGGGGESLSPSATDQLATRRHS